MDEKQREAQRRYESTDKGREARKRAWQAQNEKRKNDPEWQARRKHPRLIKAEQKRAKRLIELGLLDTMSASEKRQWLERCADVNPLLHSALAELGVA